MEAFTHHLFAARGPIDFDAIYFCRIAEAEVER
jgi:hypothetical protein